MLGRLRDDLVAVRRPLILGVALIFVAAGFEVVLPWPIKWLIDSVFGSQPLPSWIDRWLPAVTRSKSAAALAIAMAALGLGILHKLALSASQYWVIRSGNQVVLRLRARTLDHLYRLSLRFHDQSKIGDLLYRAAYDSYAVVSLLSGAFVPLATGVVVATGVLMVMLRIDVQLTLITVATAPLMACSIRLFRAKIERSARLYHESESTFASGVQESLGAVRIVQAFGLEGVTTSRLSAQAASSFQQNNRKTWWELTFSTVVGVIMAAGTSAVIGAGAVAVVHRRLWPGDVLVFLAYLGMLYQPLNAFSQSASVYHSAVVQLQRVFEILDRQPEVASRVGARRLSSVRGRVDFRDVTFSYTPGRPALESVTLSIGAGQVMGIVGKTGSGKSTLAGLLARFYDPVSGRIELDGHDLRDLDLEWLRAHISMVPQDPFLFSTTIRENIRYGRISASDADVERAAARAQAAEFIDTLPMGYDTLLGERGVNLSGGQRQRLAVARAFIRDAPMLVLDEPTSALDTHTEGELLAALSALMRGRTTVIIAHRLSTIRHADTIAVLDRGAVVEVGTHLDLLARRGFYYRLHEAQRRDMAIVPAAALAGGL